MVTINKTISFIYNPDNQSKEQLIDNFVVRLDLFKRIFTEIKTTKANFPEQHYIIEGKRGMGKTTMLLRLSYEIENDPDLNAWLIPLVFNEEEYSINTLFKFWERVAVLLEENDADFKGLLGEMNKLYENCAERDIYEEDVFKLLITRLRHHDKKILLFIDNFGDIFNKFKPREVQRLREVLQSNNDIGIVAGSSIILEAFHDMKHPFYEFFKIYRLRGLDRKETEDLLLKLDEGNSEGTIKFIIENYGGRIEALRRLTGGVIRTVVLLFEIFSDDKNGDTFKDLEILLDRVTPLYKHRMDELSSAQQEIVETLALGWDGMTVKEIAQKTKEESKVISAQLGQLVKNEIVNKIETHTKNHIYQIDERFFNIWYLMRHGKKGDVNKVKWLVRFLQEWCDEKDIIAKSKRILSALKSGEYDPTAAAYWIQALAETKYLPAAEKAELANTSIHFVAEDRAIYFRSLPHSEHVIYESILLVLLSEHRFDYLYNYITSEQGQQLYLKDHFKPIWYALMYCMREQYPNEYLKMGEELRVTVEEIIAKVAQMSI